MESLFVLAHLSLDNSVKKYSLILSVCTLFIVLMNGLWLSNSLSSMTAIEKKSA